MPVEPIDEEERAILRAAIDYHNGLVRRFRTIRKGESAWEIIGLYDDVKRHRSKLASTFIDTVDPDLLGFSVFVSGKLLAAWRWCVLKVARGTTGRHPVSIEWP